ncbi:MAG: hypothetical protein ABI382_13540, partial [Nakamurella sp.]
EVAVVRGAVVVGEAAVVRGAVVVGEAAVAGGVGTVNIAGAAKPYQVRPLWIQGQYLYWPAANVAVPVKIIGDDEMATCLLAGKSTSELCTSRTQIPASLAVKLARAETLAVAVTELPVTVAVRLPASTNDCADADGSVTSTITAAVATPRDAVNAQLLFNLRRVIRI